MSFKDCFHKKKVLVTGAGRGIGKAVVQRLSEYGAVVYALGRTQENLDALKKECPDVNTICVDLEDWSATREAVSKIGPVDFLVNNAAVFIFDTFMDMTPENFDKMMSVNVKAQINIGQIVARGMIDSKIKGRIVNVSSQSSTNVVPFPGVAGYCVTKAATDMITKAMAVELGPHEIRVNSVNPAGVDTDMLHGYFVTLAKSRGTTVEEIIASCHERTPLGTSIMEMSDIVNATLFMLSDLCQFLNGESLFVDGGRRHT